MHSGYFLKRPFDFCLALVGLALSLPLWILIIFFIWLEDSRPIFYIQERVGLKGNMFKIIKFRTMGYKENNPCFAGLLRVTALDELPQLVNILKGEMSFVGPRPLIPQELKLQAETIDRSAIRPGLTGVAQLWTSKNASVSKKAEYDSWYMKNQSIGLDVAIILRSFWVSLSRKWDKMAVSNQSKTG